MNINDFNEEEQIKKDIVRARDSINEQASSVIETMDYEVEEDDEQEEHITKKEVLKEIVSVIINVVVCFLIVFVITQFVGQRTVVSGSSMEDTLSDGDNLIVDKISYRFNDPERFDVVVFPYQYEADTYYIKRIIGLPGETVQIDGSGNIYIDGALLADEYGTETILNAGLATQEITLGDNEYFVLGDNRNNSTDSRFEAVGNIKGENIVGRAWLRIYPFNEFGFVENIE